MSENIYCKSVFEVGETFILRCDAEYSNNGHKTSAVITGTVTEANKYMCFYLKEDVIGGATSGYVLGGDYDVPNSTVEHTFSNANWNYTVDNGSTCDDCFPSLYHEPVADLLTESFYTNIPIFQTQDEAEAYQSGTLDISNAINYNKTLDENGNWVEVKEEKNELENTVVYSSEAQLLARRRIIQAKKNELFRKKYNLALLGEEYWSIKLLTQNPPQYSSITYADGTTKTNVPMLEFGDFGIKLTVKYGPFCNSFIAMNMPSNVKKISVKAYAEKFNTNDISQGNPWIHMGSGNVPMSANHNQRLISGNVYDILILDKQCGWNINEGESTNIIETVNVTEEQLATYNSYQYKYFSLEGCGGYIWLKELYIQLTDGSYWTPQ